MSEARDPADSGRWYAREWRTHVTELCEATAKHVTVIEQNVKNLTRLVWTLVSGLLAVGLAVLGWLLEKL